MTRSTSPGWLRLPLISRVALVLAAAGFVPLAIGFFLVDTTDDALLLQVQRTHLVAAKTAAERVDHYVAALSALARATARHPALSSQPRSPLSQELLRGILTSRPDVAAIAVFSASGEQVVLAQRIDLQAEVGTAHDSRDPREPALLKGSSGAWLRIREPMPEDVGQLILIADAVPLMAMVQSEEIGEQARMLLASREGEVLAGELTLADFPGKLVELARSDKIAVGSGKHEVPGSGDLVIGHARVESAPWFVLSRQPAALVEKSRQLLFQGTWIAALASLALTTLFSGLAYSNVIRPLRRLVRAQSDLVGAEIAGRSEIEQLENSYELLQQRLRDSEDLGQVFLGRYQVHKHLGTGSMGSVFQGWDPKLRRPVALKTIRLTGEDIEPEKLLASLMGEAAISANFNHPNIVTVYDVADQGSAGFIAMEFVDGVSLDVYLWRRVNLSADEAILLGAAISRALATAHERDLVHHDVKPDNVLLGFDGSIKVTDFGISQLISSAVKHQDVICGTPGYLAPECLRGQGYRPASDLFSLGLILYEALVGLNPFFGRTLRETMLNTLKLEAEPVDRAISGVPAELGALIMRLMAKDPDERPADAGAVAQAFEEMVRERQLTWNPDMEPFRDIDGAPAGTRTQLFTMTF